MLRVKYSIIAVISGQGFESKNNTREEFDKLVEMILSFGGWVVEYTVEEIGTRKEAIVW